jgi:hypothetical protein
VAAAAAAAASPEAAREAAAWRVTAVPTQRDRLEAPSISACSSSRARRGARAMDRRGAGGGNRTGENDGRVLEEG